MYRCGRKPKPNKVPKPHPGARILISDNQERIGYDAPASITIKDFYRRYGRSDDARTFIKSVLLSNLHRNKWMVRLVHVPTGLPAHFPTNYPIYETGIPLSAYVGITVVEKL